MAKIVATGELAPIRKRRRLLAKLIEQKRSCSFGTAVAALKAWGLTPTERKGNPAVAWQFRDTGIMTSFHRPHGAEDMDKGAVAHIISVIEEVQAWLANEETRRREGRP